MRCPIAFSLQKEDFRTLGEAVYDGVSGTVVVEDLVPFPERLV